MTVKKCKIWTSTSNPQFKKKLELGKNIKYWNKVCWKRFVVLALESFTYYVINVYVPRVRANADQVLTTPPRVSRDPKKCWRNMWMAPNPVLTSVTPTYNTLFTHVSTLGGESVAIVCSIVHLWFVSVCMDGQLSIHWNITSFPLHCPALPSAWARDWWSGPDRRQ